MSRVLVINKWQKDVVSYKERKYIYQDRTFQAEKFETGLIKKDKQIRKLLEIKYLKTNCQRGRYF